MKSNSIVILKRLWFNKKDTLVIIFGYNRQLINLIKTLGGFKWSTTNKYWHCDFHESKLDKVRAAFSPIVKLHEEPSILKSPDISNIRRGRIISEENKAIIRGYVLY